MQVESFGRRIGQVVLGTALVIALAPATAAATPISFVGLAPVTFTGTSSSGTSITSGQALAIFPYSGSGSVSGYQVNIAGSFGIGAPVTGSGTTWTAPLTGSLSFRGGNSLLATLQLLNIYQASSTSGGTNFGGSGNLTLVSVAGTNPTLLQFLPGGALSTTFQFNGFNPSMTLLGLSTLSPGVTNSTSYSGSMTPTSVPEPGTLLLLGSGGLAGLGMAARRRMRRRQQ